MKSAKITPLYECLSRDDELQGESNSISKPLKITAYIKGHIAPFQRYVLLYFTLFSK